LLVADVPFTAADIHTSFDIFSAELFVIGTIFRRRVDADIVFAASHLVAAGEFGARLFLERTGRNPPAEPHAFRGVPELSALETFAALAYFTDNRALAVNLQAQVPGGGTFHNARSQQGAEAGGGEFLKERAPGISRPKRTSQAIELLTVHSTSRATASMLEPPSPHRFCI
jgi:hypothetical protein